MKREKNKFVCPKDKQERMVSREVRALRMVCGFECVVNGMKDDMQERLKMIPHGVQRMNMICGGMRSLISDVIQTMTDDQAKNLLSIMHDCEVSLRVKSVGHSGDNVIMSAEFGRILINAAKDNYCLSCTKDGTECRKCDLYRVLEVTSPLEDYGDGYSCPYNLADWEE